MNLKLKRLVRTPSSEQYALFDLEQVDAAGLPLTIGKLDLHFTGEGMYGTILLWDDASRGLIAGRRSAFIRALLDEVTQPMGVPNEYVVEFFAPTLHEYEVYHNLGAGDEEAADAVADAAANAADEERRGRLPDSAPFQPR